MFRFLQRILNAGSIAFAKARTRYRTGMRNLKGKCFCLVSNVDLFQRLGYVVNTLILRCFMQIIEETETFFTIKFQLRAQ